jgi:ABC-type sugar transport system ATPase subunit
VNPPEATPVTGSQVSMPPGSGIADPRAEVLRADRISKHFGGVRALREVSLTVYADEVVGLVGDNGAGKSTLVKVLSGNFPPDSGTLTLMGEPVHFTSPVQARAMGVETVYQDLALCENLDAVANLFIGRELYRTIVGLRFLDKREMERQTRAILTRIGTQIPSVKEPVAYMSGGERQSIALGRFVAWGDKLVLLDEPTAALGVRETSRALDLVARTRREKGVSMILISHNIEHVFRIADRIVVMRHGEVAGTRVTSATTPDEIVGLIMGSDRVQSGAAAEG